MNDTPKYSSPLLIKKLNEIYGGCQDKERFEPRKSHDVKEFLKEKERQEKESQKSKMVFK